MADDKTNRGPAVRSRININEDYEVRYWTQVFECTAIELRNAVRVVGAMVSNVRWYLQRQKG
jgi:hypothetical protein